MRQERSDNKTPALAQPLSPKGVAQDERAARGAGTEDPAETLEQQICAIREALEDIQRDLADQRRHSQAMEELKDDLTRIAKDVLASAVQELDDVTPFVRTGDFTNLAKKLLRNTSRIADGLDKLESAADLMRDATPITNDIFHAVISKLDELERKGYFQVAADLQTTTDALVRALSAGSLLPALRASLEASAEQDPRTVEGYSLWRALRLTRRPEMRRLLGATMGFVTHFAQELSRRAAHPALEATATETTATAVPAS